MRVRVLWANLGALACVAACLAGCSSTPTAPSTSAPFSQTDIVVGTGAAAVAGNVLTVNYTAWFYDASKTDHKGQEFDSTTGVGPFTFSLGTSSVIPGWDQGLPGIKVGGIRRLVVPPSLAYGATRNGPVPPNATLVFDIELLEIVQ